MFCTKKSKSDGKTSTVVVNTSKCQYPIIKTVVESLGWTVTESDSKNFDVFWSDKTRGVEDMIRNSKHFQRINHFPGMNEIYNKSNLARNLQRIKSISGDNYAFFPTTWELPQAYSDIVKYYNMNSEACLIVKPKSGAKGEGIYLSRSIDSIHRDYEYIAQEYVTKPLLIDGFKFDLRIYCLVISYEPLRIFLFNEGLVRLCTQKYEEPTDENMDCTFMHLTNYALNKGNENFVVNDMNNENESSKRSLQWFWRWLAQHTQSQGMSSNVCAKLKEEIADIVIKTLIAAQPTVKYCVENAKVHSQNTNPFTCFEILGFDILVTADLHPVLLEVNHSPSFHCDSELDYNVKFKLIKDTLTLLNVDHRDRLVFMKRSIERTQSRLYGDVLSSSNSSKRSGDNENISFRKYFRDLTACNDWERYLKFESNIRPGTTNFELIYPTTCEQQTTYEFLLEKSQEAYNSANRTHQQTHGHRLTPGFEVAVSSSSMNSKKAAFKEQWQREYSSLPHASTDTFKLMEDDRFTRINNLSSSEVTSAASMSDKSHCGFPTLESEEKSSWESINLKILRTSQAEAKIASSYSLKSQLTSDAKNESPSPSTSSLQHDLQNFCNHYARYKRIEASELITQPLFHVSARK